MKYRTFDSLCPYEETIARMEKCVFSILNGAEEEIWFLEHKKVYTAGRLSPASDHFHQNYIPIVWTNRGGKMTYHGPGQRIIYLMLDLRKREKDIRKFVRKIEHSIQAVFSDLGVQTFTDESRVGVWVKMPNGEEKKIAAIGLRFQKWISSHGISLNINPDLEAFKGIVPCGLRGYGVTSLKDLGLLPSIKEVDMLLKKHLQENLIEEIL